MNQENHVFEFDKLLPLSPSNLISFETFKAEHLSSWFIYVILLAFLSGLIYMIFQAYSSIRLIQFIKRLTKGLEPEELLAKRKQLKEDAKKYQSKNSYAGKLWQEFDETLVVQKKQLRNTVDANYFFNSHSLAKEISESRLLAAFPGMLTAGGILGTFIGLQLGLAGLDIQGTNNSGTANSDQAIKLMDQIGIMISGVTVAFSTSVWGIGTSLVFNVLEKLIEAQVQKKINTLQQNIDFLYPRIVSEQTLVEIKAATEESGNLLSELGEQIGNKMQEALNESFQPAIGRLVKATEDLAQRQSETATEALKSLVEQFAEGMSKEGKDHRQGLEESASRLETIVGALGTQMNEFMANWQTEKAEQNSRSEVLLSQGKDLTERHEQIHTLFGQTLTSLSGASVRIDEAAENIREFGREIKDAANLFSSKQLEAAQTLEAAGQENRAVVERFEQLLNQIEQIRTNFLQVIEGLQGSTSNFGETMGNFTGELTGQLEIWQSQQATQNSVNETILNQATSLNDQFESNQKVMQETNELLRNSFEKFQGASEALESFGDAIKSVTETMSQQQSEALQTAQTAAAQNLKASEQLETLFKELEAMQGQFSTLGQAVEGATENFTAGFDDLKAVAQEISKKHMQYMDTLTEKFNDHLTEYSNKVSAQTRDRLDQWNQQTTTFSSLMTEAAEATKELIADLKDIFEEIKGRGDE